MAAISKPPKDCPESVQAFYDRDPRKYAVLRELMAGATREAAMAAAGAMNRATFYDWVDNDEDFAKAAQDADAYDEAQSLKRIKAAGLKDWRACETHLKLKWPKRYANTLRHAGFDGGAVKTEAVHTLNVAEMSEEELDALIVKSERKARGIAEDLMDGGG